VGVTEGRVRAWIAFMMMAGVLERDVATGQPRFFVKGGVALELRLRARARATKDIDVVLQHAEADLVRTLEGHSPASPLRALHFDEKGNPSCSTTAR
jgi:hypothetical protein